MARLRLIFMGSPDFATPTLARLIAAGHDIACVYAQPPRPAGRGQKERPVPVAAFAAERGLVVRTPASLKGADEQKDFADLGADAAVVVAYGLILPAPVLAAPRLGCLNVHASLLPRWRGAAPIHWALLDGDTETGVTIMQMDAGLDTGPMLARRVRPIGDEDTIATLHDDLAGMGAELMAETLEKLAAGKIVPERQDEAAATYARKITPEDARIDWTRPADAVLRQIRALAPKTFFEHGANRIRVHRAEAAPGTPGAAPGMVLDDHLAVACGDGAVRLLTVQRAGKPARDADDFLRGYELAAGVVLS